MHVVTSNTSSVDELHTLYTAALVRAGYQLQNTSGNVSTYTFPGCPGSLRITKSPQLYDEINNVYSPGVEVKQLTKTGETVYYEIKLFASQGSKLWFFTEQGLVHVVRKNASNTYNHNMLYTEGVTCITWSSGEDNDRWMPGLGNNIRGYFLYEGEQDGNLKFSTDPTQSFWFNRPSVRNPFLVLQPFGFGKGTMYIGTVPKLYACNGYSLPVEEEYTVGERTYLLFPSYAVTGDARVAVDVTL